MTLNGHFTLNAVFAPVCLALTVRLSKNNCMKTNKDSQILSNLSQRLLISGNIRLMRIYAGILYKEDVEGQWGRALTLLLNIFSWLSKTIA